MKKKVNIVVAEEAPEIRGLLERLVAGGLPPEAEVFYRSRNRVAVTDYNGRRLCIKAFRRPSFPNCYVYTHWRESKARRSYENSKRLQAMGFDAPDPLGYAEVIEGGRLRESYFVNEMLDGYTIRYWEERADADALLDDFADYMVRMHRTGILHRDFSPGNFLVTVGDDGVRHFNILDVNRMEFGVSDRKALMRNFRCINLDPRETARLAAKYAIAAGEDVAAVRREAVGLLAAYERNKSRHRFFKRLIGRQKGPQKRR